MSKFKLINVFIILLISSGLSFAEYNQIANSKNGMVSSQHYLATDIGVDILNKGGNAVDAAIAVGFALNVVLPRAGNIGGGGFAVILVNNQPYTIDFREKAPELASEKMYLNEDENVIPKLSTLGYKSIGVPGTVDGLWKMHQRFGKLSWSELLEPAIKLAENGFEISSVFSKNLKRYENKLSKFQPTKNIFVNIHNNKLVQKDLANSLKLIANNGRDGFYKGYIAQKIHDGMIDNDGLIRKSDLDSYQSIWRTPIIGNFMNHEIITMGPPSSGGILLIQMLNTLEEMNINQYAHNSHLYINILAESMKQAYADRAEHLGDPDFYNVPVNFLTDTNYGKLIAKNIFPGKAINSEKINPSDIKNYENIETTHYSVVDRNLNAVSLTYTLNSSYGSGVVIPGTGILMNNEMDDFSIKPGYPNQFGLLGSHANAIKPFKRPLSSMTPTILKKDNKLFMTVGTPGGSRIITTVLQSILNTTIFEMDLKASTDSLRVHHQWKPDILFLETGILESTKNKLDNIGYKTYVGSPNTSTNTIMIKDNIFYGYGDIRRLESSAKGP